MDTLGEAIIGLFIAGLVIGGVVVTVIIFGIPWLWGIVKPWLHMVTV